MGLAAFTFVGAPAPVVFLVSALASGLIGFRRVRGLLQVHPDQQPPRGPDGLDSGALFFIDEIVVHATDGSPLTFPAMFEYVMFELGPLGGYAATSCSCSRCASPPPSGCSGCSTAAGWGPRDASGLSQQDVAAQLCGIDVHRTNAVTFTLAGLLGGIAGAMTAAAVGVLSPLITIPITVKGLIVTVIGGPGIDSGGPSRPACWSADSRTCSCTSGGVNERDMYVLLLLFVFLVFRPHGIFGSAIDRD